MARLPLSRIAALHSTRIVIEKAQLESAAPNPQGSMRKWNRAVSSRYSVIFGRVGGDELAEGIAIKCNGMRYVVRENGANAMYF